MMNNPTNAPCQYGSTPPSSKLLRMTSISKAPIIAPGMQFSFVVFPDPGFRRNDGLKDDDDIMA